MSKDNKLTLMSHLLELRARLTRSAIAVIVTTGISFFFAKQLFEILKRPAGTAAFIYIDVTEMMGIYMKVCLTAGLIAAMPYIISEFIMFVIPALTRREQKYLYIVVPWVGLMFIAGVVFGYFVLLPPSMNFLLTFGSDIAEPQIRISNYVGTVTRLLLAIGGIFEMPVVTTFLARIGVISYRWLAGKRKLAAIVAFILSAIITPTMDPVNQTVVAVPLIVLYEMSIWLARLVQRKREEIVLTEPTPTE